MDISKLKPGDKVLCIDDNFGGYSYPGFHLKKKQIYTIGKIRQYGPNYFRVVLKEDYLEFYQFELYRFHLASKYVNILEFYEPVTEGLP